MLTWKDFAGPQDNSKFSYKSTQVMTIHTQTIVLTSC